MRVVSLCFVGALSVGLAACGSSSSKVDAAGGGGPDAPNGIDAAPTSDAGPVNHFITSHYTIPAGMEFYQCQRLTVDHDVYIHKITPVSGAGTHHEVLN